MFIMALTFSGLASSPHSETTKQTNFFDSTQKAHSNGLSFILYQYKNLKAFHKSSRWCMGSLLLTRRSSIDLHISTYLTFEHLIN